MSLIMSLMLLFGSIQPTEIQKGLIQRGKASFYSKKFNGRKTAYGERFRLDELTAAHRTLPHNTIVEVTNLDNDKSVLVRINDRGPHSKGRVIDLGYAAAQAIGMIQRGVANVAIRVVGAKKPTEPVVTEPITEEVLLSDASQALLQPVEPVGNN